MDAWSHKFKVGDLLVTLYNYSSRIMCTGASRQKVNQPAGGGHVHRRLALVLTCRVNQLIMS